MKFLSPRNRWSRKSRAERCGDSRSLRRILEFRGRLRNPCAAEVHWKTPRPSAKSSMASPGRPGILSSPTPPPLWWRRMLLLVFSKAHNSLPRRSLPAPPGKSSKRLSILRIELSKRAQPKAFLGRNTLTAVRTLEVLERISGENLEIHHDDIACGGFALFGDGAKTHASFPGAGCPGSPRLPDR